MAAAEAGAAAGSKEVGENILASATQLAGLLAVAQASAVGQEERLAVSREQFERAPALHTRKQNQNAVSQTREKSSFCLRPPHKTRLFDPFSCPAKR